VFEQHRTPVDVVTTSEVSVSVTIDDTRRLPEIMAALEDVADVTREDRHGDHLRVGDGLKNDPTFVGQLLEALDGVPVRMLSQAAARRNITLVIAERDLETALARVHDRFFGEESGVRLVLIGHGRMGQLVEQHAAAHGCEVAGVVTIASAQASCERVTLAP
jgi:aspartate kinase